MASNSTNIEWTDSTWNPVTGCTKVSQGCKNCYAERMALRLHAMGVKKYQNGFKVTLHPETLNEPYLWRKPKMVFVNSMSDLFHDDIPDEYLFDVFRVMKENSIHVFQVLTKRENRLKQISLKISWPANVWMGVTVEDDQTLHRIEILRNTPAPVKFLSIEPLLTELPRLNLEGIDWVIIGGESGPNARPIQKSWVEKIREDCLEQSVPFFFKQWGGVNKKRNGRILNGKIYGEMPEVYHQKEYALF